MSSRSVTLSLPPFTRAIKTLIAVNAGMYLLMVLLGALGHPEANRWLFNYLGLHAHAVVNGFVYQLVTYGFLHDGFLHLLFNMLMLWMIGSMLETTWGSRRFWEFYLVGIVGAAVGTVALAYTVGSFVHLSPDTNTVGASGGIYAIM